MNVVRLRGATRPFFVVHAKPGLVRCGDVEIAHEDIARDVARALADASGLRAVVVPGMVPVDLVEPSPGSGDPKIGAPDAASAAVDGAHAAPEAAGGAEEPRCGITYESFRCTLRSGHVGGCCLGHP